MNMTRKEIEAPPRPNGATTPHERAPKRMKNVPCFSPSCKIWIKKDPADMAALLVQCTDCGAICSFKLVSIKWITEWDIDIPEDWQFGQWDLVCLHPVSVPRPVLLCTACNLRVLLTPSFVLKGTRLTLDAIAFVILAKEVGGLKWRSLSKLFCSATERLAHSTLYMAVHKMGKLLGEQVKELSRHFATDLHVPVRNRCFAAPSALFRHTLERELGARFLIAPLLPFGAARFSRLFYQHIDNWSRTVTVWKKSLPRLYGPYHRRCARIAA